MARAYPIIPVFRNLDIPDAAERLDELVAQVDARLSPPWTHDYEVERGDWTHGLDFRVYLREPVNDRPGLRLHLVPREGVVRVANITPSQKSQLTIDEYNQALVEFNERYLSAAAAELGLQTIVGTDVLDLGRELPADVFDALALFSAAANRSTGSGHPMDQERWFAFVVGVHRAGCDLSPTDLGRWLELDGWSDEMAVELAIEFETATALLRYADNN